MAGNKDKEVRRRRRRRPHSRSPRACASSTSTPTLHPPTITTPTARDTLPSRLSARDHCAMDGTRARGTDTGGAGAGSKFGWHERGGRTSGTCFAWSCSVPIAMIDDDDDDDGDGGSGSVCARCLDGPVMVGADGDGLWTGRDVMKLGVDESFLSSFFNLFADLNTK
ncbi:uncharacterized protein K452DRAFT_332202 [Aplosporella prunicola CBS 121167]|uniref:Uncharacterized protein n=1 Tax=Aplosporella prunicola CBS 121167 TaxID=1176127 RepID=A0A6A6BIU5_9PEZI|nr:uncharacterized protein K452DRAFT_332202 [Aplosporella prunicola CBS 121167]KAF2142481.1 hypothetical protein K452DRAFT_332202 [Aplosporella prunicola CBS 121167]